MPLLALLAQAGLALVICFLGRPIAARSGLIDAPDDHRKLHERPTPLVGGLAVMIPVLIAAALNLPALLDPAYLSTVTLAMFFFFVGLFDDRKHVPASRRFTLAFVITAVGFAFVQATVRQ